MWKVQIALLIVLAAATAHAQQTNLPAGEYFRRGMEAAARNDFETAAIEFDHARRADPANMQALFNTALADAQVPGMELFALGWLEAYLEANPDIPDREHIRGQIASLQQRVLSQLRTMADAAEHSASEYRNNDDRDLALKWAAWMRANAADETGARRIASRFDGDYKKHVDSYIDNAIHDYKHSHCDDDLFLYGTPESLSPPKTQQAGNWPDEYRRERHRRWSEFMDQQIIPYLVDVPNLLKSLSTSNAAPIDLLQKLLDASQNTRGNFVDIQRFLTTRSIESQDAAEKAEQGGDLVTAAQYYDHAVQTCPNYGTIWAEGGDAFRKLGWQQLRDGNNGSAIDNFTQCMRRKNRCAQGFNKHCTAPEDAECRFDRALAHFVQGQFELAALDFEGASEEPRAQVWHYLAESREASEKKTATGINASNPAKPDPAVDLFSDIFTASDYAAQARPDSCDVQFFLGEYALLHGQTAQAKDHFVEELTKTALCGESAEYIAARGELKRLVSGAKRKPVPTPKDNDTRSAESAKEVPVLTPVAGLVMDNPPPIGTHVKAGQLLTRIDTASSTHHTSISAPIDGTIMDVRVDQGNMVGSASVLFAIKPDTAPSQR